MATKCFASTRGFCAAAALEDLFSGLVSSCQPLSPCVISCRFSCSVATICHRHTCSLPAPRQSPRAHSWPCRCGAMSLFADKVRWRAHCVNARLQCSLQKPCTHIVAHRRLGWGAASPWPHPGAAARPGGRLCSVLLARAGSGCRVGGLRLQGVRQFSRVSCSQLPAASTSARAPFAGVARVPRAWHRPTLTRLPLHPLACVSTQGGNLVPSVNQQCASKSNLTRSTGGFGSSNPFSTRTLPKPVRRASQLLAPPTDDTTHA